MIMRLPLLVIVLGIVVSTMHAYGPANDPYFPQFHVRPSSNWINDPNGPFRSPTTGLVHLWMQYNPFAAVWGNMSWWHAVSADYVTWQAVGVSLTNDQAYDKNGVFSGSVTVDAVTGIPTIVYTCVSDQGVQLQCSASPADPTDPLLRTWTKAPANPIVAQMFPGEAGGNFRDPTTAWLTGNASQFYEVAFAGSRYVPANASSGPFDAVVVVYKGLVADKLLAPLTFSHVLLENSALTYFECPDVIGLEPIGPSQQPLVPGTPYALKTSEQATGSHDFFRLGSFTSGRVFEERAVQPVDFGAWYASKTFWDPVAKMRVLWGWLLEEDAAFSARGWAGAQSIPRTVTYDQALGLVRTYPLAALDALHVRRIGHVPSSTPIPTSGAGVVVVPADGAVGPEGLLALQQDIQVEVRFTVAALQDPTQATPPFVGLRFRATDGGAQYAEVAVTVLPESGVELNNTDSPGGDYLDFPSPSTIEAENVANCSAACSNDRRCLSWSFVRVPGPFPPYNYAPRCSLKNQVPPFVPSSCCVTARVGSPVLAFTRDKSGTTGSAAAVVGRLSLPDVDAAGVATVPLRVLVDHSVVEVFANRGLAAISGRLYIPTAANLSSGVTVAANIDANVSAGSVWSVGSIWLE